jgi:hypothetical protein
MSLRERQHAGTRLHAGSLTAPTSGDMLAFSGRQVAAVLHLLMQRQADGMSAPHVANHRVLKGICS